jgi:Glutathione synthase/Ribosomal protein S6 modification enzyme (glutaminyl transferase)
MWAKIEIVPSDQKIIFLPPALAVNSERVTTVIVGGKSTSAGIEYRDDLQPPPDNSFETPVTLKLSDKLRDELSIPESPVYKIKIRDCGITFGPVIGLLLGNATHRYNPVHMMKYSDRFGIYPKVGGLIYAFSPKYIHWEDDTVYGLYYNNNTALWEYGCFPLPEVIYRRDFHTDPDIIGQLARYTGGRLFNSYRFTKDEFYDFVKCSDELKQYLPPTEPLLEFDQIRDFISHHHRVILKPVHLSRGRGICVIEKTDSKYKVIDFRPKTPIVYELFNEDLFKSFFDVYQDLFDKYLMQKYLSLAKIGNSPFDIRVVMQKQPDMKWGCTGIECRVSNNGYLTNISRGGYALPLGEALRQTFVSDHELLQEQIGDLCRNFCRHMETSGEHFAEFGLDIAIDTDKKLWLIEANVFPSFKGFKKMDLDTYLSIRYTPLLYASSLTKFGEPKFT